MSTDAETNRASTQWLADAFKEVDWPLPPYLQLGGFLAPLAKAIVDAPSDAKLDIVREHLSGAYNARYLAVMYSDRYSRILHVRDFSQQIDQSIHAYFCGYTLNAVTGLIPVIEGIIRKMAMQWNRDVGSGTKNLIVELQALVDREEQSPDCYGERLVMLESFRDFVRSRLLERTDRYAGFDELNRHGILHGLFENFGRDINFYRLITVLDLLCFSIGLGEGISMFAPADTCESLRLAAEYEAVRWFHMQLEKQRERIAN